MTLISMLYVVLLPAVAAIECPASAPSDDVRIDEACEWTGAGQVAFRSLTINAPVRFVPSGGCSYPSLKTTVTLTVLEAGSIVADPSPVAGSGAGASSGGTGAGGSYGGHGGPGSIAFNGPTTSYGAHDSVNAHCGSQGGAGSSAGGLGGGIVKLDVGSTLQVNGLIEASGQDAAQGSAAGGGSGGSIDIKCNSIVGIAPIRANGGNGDDFLGGGGAGGRIKIDYGDISRMELTLFEAAGGFSGLPNDLGGSLSSNGARSGLPASSATFSSSTAWLPPVNNPSLYYLNVDLRSDKIVTEIATKGKS